MVRMLTNCKLYIKSKTLIGAHIRQIHPPYMLVEATRF